MFWSTFGMNRERGGEYKGGGQVPITLSQVAKSTLVWKNAETISVSIYTKPQSFDWAW